MCSTSAVRVYILLALVLGYISASYGNVGSVSRQFNGLVLSNNNKCSRTCPPGFKCQMKPCTCQACVAKSCADIHCPAGFTCQMFPDGPDCVKDVPTCKGFFCRRGTNCYIREGEPVCLPNTCEVRVCSKGLTCIDTKNGALCRRGVKKTTCKDKFCLSNTKCVQDKERGAICVKI